jgi:hypothetical protein
MVERHFGKSHVQVLLNCAQRLPDPIPGALFVDFSHIPHAAHRSHSIVLHYPLLPLHPDCHFSASPADIDRRYVVQLLQQNELC